jgi:hypothetical protein
LTPIFYPSKNSFTLSNQPLARAVLRGGGFELAQQLTLALGEVDRRLDYDVAEEVAGNSSRIAARLSDAHSLFSR